MQLGLARVLAEYNERWAHEFENVIPGLTAEQVVQRRDAFLMSVGPDAGAFLELLVRSAKAASILELGTSFGHSTVYLAHAAQATGGHVTTCDLDAGKQDFAREMLGRAGLEKHVTFVTGDAVSVIEDLSGKVDFCLIDLWMAEYVRAFEALYPRLAVKGYAVADNMVVPETTEAADYRRAVRDKDDLESVLLPIGWGLEVSRRVTRAKATRLWHDFRDRS